MSRLSSYAGIAAVVTGASSGIGRLLALRLAKGERAWRWSRDAPIGNALDPLDIEAIRQWIDGGAPE